MPRQDESALEESTDAPPVWVTLVTFVRSSYKARARLDMGRGTTGVTHKRASMSMLGVVKFRSCKRSIR